MAHQRGMSHQAAERPTIFEAAGGATGMLALAHAWHTRCLADPVAEHPFGHSGQHPRHTERLAAYWGEMLGGPDDYTRELASEAHLVRLHSGNGPHPDLDAATERCFVLALDDAGIADPQLRTNLVEWFSWANQVVNHSYPSRDQVPEDLRLPKWTWDGPVS
jgi:hemoglobin